jgi:hypothetical protein
MSKIGFLTEWQLYAQKIEGDSWSGEKIDEGKLAKMSGKFRLSVPLCETSLMMLMRLQMSKYTRCTSSCRLFRNIEAEEAVIREKTALKCFPYTCITIYAYDEDIH